MPERTAYAPGTPSWVDIGTDVEGAKAFYGGLFGWETAEAGPAEETGGYGFFTRGGKPLAGVGPQQSPGPPFWTTYVTVADADETTSRVKEAGGQVVVEPMDVMTAGRMAVFQDPAGAFISIWQPGDHIGAAIVNEPVSLCWNELNTRDPDAAKEFYPAVFGWEMHDMEIPGMSYTEIKAGGETVAGMVDMRGRVPEGVPDHWLVYFAVDDTDAVVEKAKGLGGSVMVPPTDIPPGRFSVLTDPQGAAFAVLRFNAPA